MRKIFLFSFLILFLTFSVSGLECQYKDIEKYYEMENVFYQDGEVIGYNLKIDNAIKLTIDQLYITIHNELDYDVSLEIIYQVYSVWYGRNEQRIVDVNVPARGSETIKDPLQDTYLGDSKVWIKELGYKFSGKYAITNKVESVEKSREICKICPNGKECLDDESACKISSNSSECGSGVCNIAGFCGKEFIVSCEPYGKENCNNQTCLTPSTKKNGESYSCEWECKSGIGDGTKCKKSKTEVLMILGVLLLAFGLGTYFIIKSFNKSDWEKQKNKILTDAEEKAKEIFKEAEVKLEKINSDLESKNKEKIRLQQEIDSLGESEEIKRKLIRTIKEIKILENQQEIESEKLKKEREKLTQERLTPFTNKQGYKVYLSEDGYEVLERTGTLFHRWWFEHNHNKKIKEGYEIHHKDFHKRNNNIKNLEELSPEEHKQRHYQRYKE